MKLSEIRAMQERANGAAKRRTCVRFNDESRELLRQMAPRCTAKEIAAELGMSTSSIYKEAKRLGFGLDKSRGKAS